MEDKDFTQLGYKELLSIVVLILFCCLFLFIYTLSGDSIKFDGKRYKPLTSQEQELRAAKNVEAYETKVENGIHIQTGLKYGPGFSEVRIACLSCHSSKLITQNRSTREGWKDMIRWMQATQGLPPLGVREPVILDYLARYYAPSQISRRASINPNEIEWYVLSQDNQ